MVGVHGDIVLNRVGNEVIVISGRMVDIPVNSLTVFPYMGFTVTLHTDDILELEGFAIHRTFVAVDDGQPQGIILCVGIRVDELYLGS